MKKGKTIVVVAPHPDDETLGCGGTILRHLDQGDQVFWVIVTQMESPAYTIQQQNVRRKEISKVSDTYKFTGIFEFKFETTKLNSENFPSLVGKLSSLFKQLQPDIVYSPFGGDIHTDHYWVFKSVMSCSKWFRSKSIKKILCYETISETEFGDIITAAAFQPNVFIDISKYLTQKIKIMKFYKSELHEHPKPRSEKNIQALATLRGATSGFEAAESFLLIKEII